MDLPASTPVTGAPRCPRCGSADTLAQRSQRITGGLEYDGAKCGAQRQFRHCRACGDLFPVIRIGSPLLPDANPKRGWVKK